MKVWATALQPCARALCAPPAISNGVLRASQLEAVLLPNPSFETAFLDQPPVVGQVSWETDFEAEICMQAVF